MCSQRTIHRGNTRTRCRIYTDRAYSLWLISLQAALRLPRNLSRDFSLKRADPDHADMAGDNRCTIRINLDPPDGCHEVTVVLFRYFQRKVTDLRYDVACSDQRIFPLLHSCCAAMTSAAANRNRISAYAENVSHNTYVNPFTFQPA